MAILRGITVSHGLPQRLHGVLPYNTAHLAEATSGSESAFGGAVPYRTAIVSIADDAAHHSKGSATRTAIHRSAVNGSPESAVHNPPAVTLAGYTTSTVAFIIARVTHAAFYRKVGHLCTACYYAEKTVVTAIILNTHPADGVSRTVERNVPP